MEELEDSLEISGGDYVEKTFGILMAMGFGAAIIGSGGMLAVACVAGVAFAGLDSF